MLKLNFNYTVYCYTNFNEIISVSTTFNAPQIVYFISIYNHSSNIDRLLFVNHILIFGDANGVLKGYNLLLKILITFPIMGKLKSVLFLDNYYYFVIDDSFIRTIYDQTNSMFFLA